MRTSRWLVWWFVVLIGWPTLAAAESRELLQRGFYRSATGRAIAAFPQEVMAHPIQSKEFSGARMFMWIAPRQYVATLLFPSSKPIKEAMPELMALFKETTKSVGMKLDGLKPITGEQTTDAGKVTLIRMGPDAKGMSAIALIVTDGDDAVAIYLAGIPKHIEPLALAFANRVRVGAKVPTLADRQPGTRLAGIYQSRLPPKNAAFRANWYVFDARGYVSEEVPSDELTLDVEAQVQRASLGEPAYLWSYRIAGGKLVLTPLTKRGVAKSIAFSDTGAMLEIDGDKYYRVQPSEVSATTMFGVWEASEVTSAGGAGGQGGTTAAFSGRLRLDKDGSASYGSSTMVTGAGYDAGGNLDWTIGASGTERPWKGTYTIAGHRIRVTTSDGKQLVLVLMPYRLETGAAAPSIVFINGTGYKRL